MSALDNCVASTICGAVDDDERDRAHAELAELRAKAARCDAYEREGEALLETQYEGPQPFIRAQLARCRARVEAAIASPGWREHGDPDDVACTALIATVREALR